MTSSFAVILGYVALQLVIAWLVSRRITGEDDYLVAGRSLGPVLCTFSIFATWFGAETCVAAAAATYEGGLSAASGDPFGYALCLLILGAVFARALWNRKLSTFADLYRQRYGPNAERLFAILLIPSSLLWAAAEIRAMGQVLAANSEFGVFAAMTFAAAVAVAYTTLGGLKADAITDLVQGGTIALGVLALAWTVFGRPGGVSLGELPRERLMLLDTSRPALENLELWALPVLGGLFAAEIVARVAAARSAAVAQRGTVLGGVLFLGFGTLVAVLGVAASTMEVEGVEHSEQILLELASAQLGPLWATLFSGALVAAILSTVDSALLTAGSLAAHNLVIPLRPHMDDRARLRLNRLAVVGFGVLAYFLATRFESVYELIEQSSAFATAGVVVATPIALFTRVGGPAAAISSLLAGAGFYWYGAYLAQWPYPYLTAVAAAVAAYAAGTLLGRSRSMCAQNHLGASARTDLPKRD